MGVLIEYVKIMEVSEVKKYLKDALGIDVKITQVKTHGLNALPLYLTNEYDIHKIELYQHNFLLVLVKNDFTAENLRKHLEILGNAFDTVPIAVTGQIEAYKRSRLIEKKIPFIIPGRQMYLPDLLIDIKEYFNVPRGRTEVMRPAMQLMLLYHIQVQSLEGISLKVIAKRLGYDAATVTRAAAYFQSTGLCRTEGTKEKQLKFEKSKRELWEMAEPWMSTPVSKTRFYTGNILNLNLKKANSNALAHYTDINDEPVDYFAMPRGYGKFLDGSVNKTADQREGNFCLEEWKYDPVLLTTTDFVDPLSLYLCFRESRNERIEIARDKLIGQVQW